MESNIATGIVNQETAVANHVIHTIYTLIDNSPLIQTHIDKLKIIRTMYHLETRLVTEIYNVK